MNTIRTPLLIGLLSAATLLIAAPAQARTHWSVNLGLGFGGYYPAPHAYYPAPRPYYYPAPAVVYQPAPQVVYQAVPVYAQPEVIYQQPVVVYDRPVRHVYPPHYYERVAPHGYGYNRGYREYRDYRR